MAKLTDMQLVLLATACQRDDGSLLPPPASLGDQATRIHKAVTTLVKRELAREVDVTDAAAMWREEDERRVGVTITEAGRAVIAAEEASDEPLVLDDRGSDGEMPVSPEVALEPTPAATLGTPRTGTKQALVLEMLRGDAGASLADLVAATGWLPHTMRAALTGLRKKGYGVITERLESGTRYRIAEVA